MTVRLTVDGAVGTITLQRPERLNALDRTMLEDLARALDDAADPALRCLVITGTGRGFCAGADLSPGQYDDGVGVATIMRSWFNPLVGRIVALEKPTIAAVNGVAAGGGISLALACDFRVAGPDARFVPAFIRRGLVPDLGMTYFLPRLLGTARALEFLMLGDPVDAAGAMRLGLLTSVAGSGSLEREVFTLARRLASGPTRSYELTRRAVLKGACSDLSAALENEVTCQTEAVSTRDYAEGLDAFIDKRDPRFTGD